jgi:phosphoribosylamine--glycine ligase
MEKVGVLVVSYGSRGVALADTLSKSENYEVEFFIVDKQRNPFNIKKVKEHGGEHVVISDLGVEKIFKFVKKRKEKIDFGIVGPEGPIISGIRDKVEPSLGIPMVCPTKEFALEESKVRQRNLLQECCSEINPKFKVFDPRKDGNKDEVKKKVFSWLNELKNEVAVKPDKPGYGKGVGVWGDHFSTREELFRHFTSIYETGGTVIVEKKIDGEESSFQSFCDGKRIRAFPETRDYKRAFDEDKGQNTGGMGCYNDNNEYLPFMTSEDKEKELEIVEKIFKNLRGNGKNEGLRGIPFYVAFIHSREGPKILEINSRGGDPEVINILSILKNDFVELCFQMIEGNLERLNFEKKATVLTYKVPPSYGGFEKEFPEKMNKEEVGTPINLEGAYELARKVNLKIYPGSLELREDGKNYALGSRTVASVGIGETIEDAREISLEGIKAIKGGGLWYRNDIASKEHINKSIEHMKRLRREKNESYHRNA